MLRRMLAFVQAEEGQDLVEYALLAALLSVASVAALTTLGPVVAGLFESIIPLLEV